MATEESKILPNLGMATRQKVLTYSLLVESTTSFYLGALLGVKQTSKSKSFGNTSSALSFNAKINLLIDIGAFERDVNKKFTTFMEIRNQFIHNINAKDYEKCLSYLEGREVFLFKNYPPDITLSKGKQLEIAFASLAEDVLDITLKLREQIDNKIRIQVDADTSEPKMKSFKYSIETVEEFLNTNFNEDNFGTLNEKDFNSLGTKVKKMFWREATKKYIELTKNYIPLKKKGDAKS